MRWARDPDHDAVMRIAASPRRRSHSVPRHKAMQSYGTPRSGCGFPAIGIDATGVFIRRNICLLRPESILTAHEVAAPGIARVQSGTALLMTCMETSA